MATEAPNLPIPISCITDRYLLFDINAISYLRRNHNICGVFIGTLAQTPSQNVFLGLPMEITPEEAQMLIDKDLGCILDDARAHDEAMATANQERQDAYVEEVREKVAEVSDARARSKQAETKQALKKQKGRKPKLDGIADAPVSVEALTQDDDESLFSPAAPSRSSTSTPTQRNCTTTSSATMSMTPTTSTSLLPPRSPSLHHHTPHLLGQTSSSLSLLTHLQSRKFFTTPGLSFGCQFCVYPGDPLRFHSHFLAVSVDWEEEMDLMDIVSGGRLGTGVKKGWLVGGEQPAGASAGGESDKNEVRMRTFSVEWAGM